MIPPAPQNLVRRLRVPGYVFLVIAMLLPFLDLLIAVYPLRPGTLAWRFGVVGLLSSAMGAPLLVLFLLYALALLLGDRKVMIAIGSFAAVIALCLVGGAGAFALDALQMKARVAEAAQQKFMMASAQALLKLVLEALSAVVLSVSVFRTLSSTKAVGTARPEPRVSASLLAARQSGSRPAIVTDVAPAAGTPPTDTSAAGHADTPPQEPAQPDSRAPFANRSNPGRTTG